ncbi:MAG: protein kinase domain-containing protein, partial [Chitinivibrionales bacterium]
MKIDEYEKLTGKSLGNITLLKIIGTGSMGVVFVGYQNSLKRKVAVKILPRELNDEKRREKFREEAELVAGLDHPNINMIFEIGEEEGYFFQVMKLITGGDLDKMIKKRRRHPVPSKRVLPLEKTLEMISQILDGLAYAHEEEIIH